MKKIYLVYSSDEKPFDKLVNQCQISFSNIQKVDVKILRFENAILPIQNKRFRHYNNKELFKLSERISDILDKYNDNTFKLIVNKIEYIDGDRNLIFVRINDLKIITKLKRVYKRSKYITIRIDNNEEFTIAKRKEMLHYTFDIIINNVSEDILKMQILNFVNNKIPKKNFIHR